MACLPSSHWLEIIRSRKKIETSSHIFWFAINAINNHRNRKCFEFIWCFLFLVKFLLRICDFSSTETKTQSRKKISSETRQSVHLNCQIKLSSALCSMLYILNFTSLLKIQIHFYFKEYIFVHCVWNRSHFFRMVTSFLWALSCVYDFVFSCALEMFVCSRLRQSLESS